jgi:glycerol kinase
MFGAGNTEWSRGVEDQLILTIDVGSSSVRASLYDRMGRYVSDTEARLS